MSPTKALKVRVALLCILVGIVLALVAVVTDHWAVLSPHVEHHNATCEAAHFGLWRICTKRIFVGDKERSCGPITLPGGNVPARPAPVGGRAPETRARLGGGGGPAAAVLAGRSRAAECGRCLQLVRAPGSGLVRGQGSGWAGRPRLSKENAGLPTQPGRPAPTKRRPQVGGPPGGVHSRLECGLKGSRALCKRGCRAPPREGGRREPSGRPSWVPALGAHAGDSPVRRDHFVRGLCALDLLLAGCPSDSENASSRWDLNACLTLLALRDHT